jgi:hypothetical protein
MAVRDSDGFGRGSDLGGFGRIPSSPTGNFFAVLYSLYGHFDPTEMDSVESRTRTGSDGFQDPKYESRQPRRIQLALLDGTSDAMANVTDADMAEGLMAVRLGTIRLFAHSVAVHRLATEPRDHHVVCTQCTGLGAPVPATTARPNNILKVGRKGKSVSEHPQGIKT